MQNGVPLSVRWLVAAALVLTAACGGRDESKSADSGAVKPANAGASTSPGKGPADLAQVIFTTRCVTCHGTEGAGDGPGSLGLDPKPRDLTSPEWQASVTDEHIEKIIMYGGTAVGKSAAMPPNPDLMAKKPVVEALRAKVRSLEKP